LFTSLPDADREKRSALFGSKAVTN